MPDEILTPEQVIAFLDRLQRTPDPTGRSTRLADRIVASHRALEKEVKRLHALLEEIRYDGMERLAPSENPNY